MNNTDRNIRTLIICFGIAIIALVPLRIIEQKNLEINEATVLGDQTEYVIEEPLEEVFVVEEEVIEENVLGEQTEDEVGEVIEEEIVLPEIEE